MQLPHSVQPVRAGPAPPKYGSGTVTPGSRPGVPSSRGRPKNTPTGVWRNVWPTPISSATALITASTVPLQGFSATPSIREAWS